MYVWSKGVRIWLLKSNVSAHKSGYFFPGPSITCSERWNNLTRQHVECPLSEPVYINVSNKANKIPSLMSWAFNRSQHFHCQIFFEVLVSRVWPKRRCLIYKPVKSDPSGRREQDSKQWSGHPKQSVDRITCQHRALERAIDEKPICRLQ